MLSRVPQARHQIRTASLHIDWHRICMMAMTVTLLFCNPVFSKADDILASEYRIKAAFLYNFSRFTSWPDEVTSQTDDFRLCVLGIDPFGEAIDALSGKPVHNKTVSIHKLDSMATAGYCHMVFVSVSESGRLDEVLTQLQHESVLTISDIDSFTARGGIIQLKLVNGKIRFDINIDAARRAGLDISSKLLSLATIVRDEEGGKTP